MTKKYKYIIWDWNGTILDDVELCVRIMNGMLEKRGLARLSVEAYRAVFRFPVEDYYAAAGFDFSKESFEKVGKEWMDEYEKQKLSCGLRDGVLEVIGSISASKTGQAVLSAYSQNELKETVGYYGLTKYFTHLYGLDTIYAPSKVALGKKLMKELGAKKGETLLIGDTVHDFVAAAGIGADCVLISNGHQSRAQLAATGASVLSAVREVAFLAGVG